LFCFGDRWVIDILSLRHNLQTAIERLVDELTAIWSDGARRARKRSGPVQPSRVAGVWLKEAPANTNTSVALEQFGWLAHRALRLGKPATAVAMLATGVVIHRGRGRTRPGARREIDRG
jgi:hypothetical protein